MENDPAFLRRLYDHRFDERRREEKQRIWKVLVESFFQKHVASTAAVLDLGCGFGEFLNPLRCARRAGVDLQSEAPKHLEPGVEFHPGDVRDLSRFGDSTFDVVFTSNLMEHLPSKDDVARMVRSIAASSSRIARTAEALTRPVDS